jgi:hypothetical protein
MPKPMLEFFSNIAPVIAGEEHQQGLGQGLGFSPTLLYPNKKVLMVHQDFFFI